MPIEQFGRTTSAGVIPRGSGHERFGVGGYVRVTGWEALHMRILNTTAGAAAARDLRVVVGSDVYYAAFVNWGTRFMQGRFFLQVAQAAAQTYLQRNLPRAITEGPAAVLAAFHAAGEAGLKAMLPTVPVRTGLLKRQQRSRLYGSRG